MSALAYHLDPLRGLDGLSVRPQPVIGAFPATAPVTDPFGGRYLAIRRIAVGSRADFEAMNRAIRAHRMRPVIDRVLPFDEAVRAYRYFRDGNPFGKVVVDLQP